MLFILYKKKKNIKIHKINKNSFFYIFDNIYHGDMGGGKGFIHDKLVQ